jgi:hypothetical protein
MTKVGSIFPLWKMEARYYSKYGKVVASPEM